MNVEFFQARSLRVEAQRTDNGWQFIAWRPGTSQGFTDSASLLKWAKWPIKTPTGDALRQWLRALEQVAAQASEPVVDGLDETDPNHQTRTVI